MTGKSISDPCFLVIYETGRGSGIYRHRDNTGKVYLKYRQRRLYGMIGYVTSRRC
jgi:hypothetical protein